MTGAGAGRAAACGRAAVRRTAATLVLDLRRGSYFNKNSYFIQ